MKTGETTVCFSREHLGVELTDSPVYGTRGFSLDCMLEDGLLEDQHVIIHLLNGAGAVTEDDVRLHGLLEEASTHRVTAVNKVDLLDEQERAEFSAGVFEQLGLQEEELIFVSARRGDGADELVRTIAEILPAALRDGFIACQQASVDAKDTRARALIYSNAVVAAAVAAIPIPVADVLVILPLQLAMVTAIGSLYGVDVSWRRAVELLTTLGAGIGLREAARQLVKLVPGWGSAVSAGIAFGGTAALGELAMLLFKNEVGLDPEELRRVYEAAARKARGRYDDQRPEVEGVADDLAALREQWEGGNISQDEFELKLAELGA